ncbi:MAG: hypothetical protein QW587_09285 [Candidatus Bathyarchaeia archaeon]
MAHPLHEAPPLAAVDAALKPQPPAREGVPARVVGVDGLTAIPAPLARLRN